MYDNAAKTPSIMNKRTLRLITQLRSKSPCRLVILACRLIKMANKTLLIRPTNAQTIKY